MDEPPNIDELVARASAPRTETEDAYLRKVWVAMMLAEDIAACCALLRGEKVHPARLDRSRLAQFRREGLWDG